MLTCNDPLQNSPDENSSRNDDYLVCLVLPSSDRLPSRAGWATAGAAQGGLGMRSHARRGNLTLFTCTERENWF